MPASPNLSSRMRDEIDEVYTFSVKHKKIGYDEKKATVLVNYHDDGTATVIANNPPGMQGYHVNYSIDDDPKREREHELAKELLNYVESVMDGHDIKTSSWTSNSGNRSLNDIYVKVEVEKVDQVLLNMYQFLHHAREEYIAFLQEFEPNELVEPTSSIEEKVVDIVSSTESSISVQ